jgi:hypothetical protein
VNSKYAASSSILNPPPRDVTEGALLDIVGLSTSGEAEADSNDEPRSLNSFSPAKTAHFYKALTRYWCTMECWRLAAQCSCTLESVHSELWKQAEQCMFPIDRSIAALEEDNMQQCFDLLKVYDFVYGFICGHINGVDEEAFSRSWDVDSQDRRVH